LCVFSPIKYPLPWRERIRERGVKLIADS